MEQEMTSIFLSEQFFWLNEKKIPYQPMLSPFQVHNSGRFGSPIMLQNE